jgi:nicotinamide riboside kinase
MDHIREVPKGATEMVRTVCKETLQSLVTTFTNMEFKSWVKRFTRTAEAIANYVGKEYSKEMKLLVKNHQKEKTNPKSR